MSEFEDKLNSVLGDPAQMEKIANLAKTLMGGDGGAQEPSPEPFGGLDIDPRPHKPHRQAYERRRR